MKGDLAKDQTKPAQKLLKMLSNSAGLLLILIHCMMVPGMSTTH